MINTLKAEAAKIGADAIIVRSVNEGTRGLKVGETPVSIAGNGVPAKAIFRRVAPTDIAPTITAYLGVKPPSGSVGNVLWEIWEH